MSKSPIAAVVLGLLLAAPAWAEEAARAVPAFSALAFAGSGELDVTVGKPQSVVLVGDPELLRHITTEVKGNTLTISYDHNFHWNGPGVTARISVPKLAALDTRGSARAMLAGFSGGDTAFSVRGSGDIDATGKLDTLTLTIDGSGNAKLDKLATDSATVTINGSGHILVQPKRSLAANIHGSGEVRYLGSPQVTSQVHGSGTIQSQ